MNRNGFFIDTDASDQKYLFVDVDAFTPRPANAKPKASWWTCIRCMS